jgi:hypothetical protein
VASSLLKGAPATLPVCVSLVATGTPSYGENQLVVSTVTSSEDCDW